MFAWRLTTAISGVSILDAKSTGRLGLLFFAVTAFSVCYPRDIAASDAGYDVQ
jgi:hypothetical protein